MAVSIIGKSLKMRSLRSCIYQQLRTGYVILLPEVDPGQIEKNPLYKNGLPNVEELTPEKCLNALGSSSIEFERVVRDVEINISGKTDEIDLFSDVVDPIETQNVQLDSTWGLTKALYLTNSQLMPSEAYLPFHERARKAKSSRNYSKAIYHQFKNCDLDQLSEEEQRVVLKYRLEGKLNGLDVDGHLVELYRLKSIALAKERNDFKKRVHLSTGLFKWRIYDPIVVRDFPKELLEAYSANATNYYDPPWHVTLRRPDVTDKFLAHCPVREQRKLVWTARRQIASIFTDQPPELNNSESLERIRDHKREIAKVLGYANYADLCMETKMAGSVDNVQKTLDLILDEVNPALERELNELQEFANEQGFGNNLQPWDIPYWARKHRMELYSWDDTRSRDYFPLEKVLMGCMKLTERTFGLKYELVANHKAWQPDIRLYNIYEAETNKLLGAFYLDLFARPNKYNAGEGAAQLINLRPVSQALGSNPPLSILIFNFNRPEAKNVHCLLDISGVEIIFKKFGKALQQLLCGVNYSEVSGLTNVEWDAVDVVSNFMSNWISEPEVLHEISGHYSTNEPVPVQHLNQIRNHMMSFKVCNQIFLSNLDLELHKSKEFWRSLAKTQWLKHFPHFEHFTDDALPLSFAASACDTSASVFSTVWSKMLADDLFEQFRNDPDKESAGARFRDTFLSFGGACHSREVFRRFQGRDPTPDAFVRRIVKAAA